MIKNKSKTSRYPFKIETDGQQFVIENNHAFQRYKERHKIVFNESPNDSWNKFFALLKIALNNHLKRYFEIPYGYFEVGRAKKDDKGYWEVIVDANNPKYKIIRTVWHTYINTLINKERKKSRRIKKKKRKFVIMLNKKQKERKRVKIFCREVAGNWSNQAGD